MYFAKLPMRRLWFSAAEIDLLTVGLSPRIQ